MKGSIFETRTGLCFLVILSCVFSSNLVRAAPQPLPPGMIYRERYTMDDGGQMIERLKQIVERQEEIVEKDLAKLEEDQMALQAINDAKVRNQREQEFSVEDSEALPVPAAVFQSSPNYGKRTSYMSLCHFKICNMGRKRQI